MSNTVNNPMKISMIMLGCPKNDVDAEAMLYQLREAGHEIISDPEQADAIIVNTCGFIKDAKQQSVDTLLEMAEFRKNGRCRLLVATGCLTQRYQDQLFDAMPEVDMMVGVNDYSRIAELLEETGGRKLVCADQAAMPELGGRVLSTPKGYAYLKIAEGCSNRCAYCAIPDIRGPYRSRQETDVLRETEWLTGQGVPEIILVAQDTTRYGMDHTSGQPLVSLLKKLTRIDGIGRLRLLYCYPELVSDELLELVSGEPKVCNYLDIPLQHIDDGMLKRMNRRSGEAQIRTLIEKIRKHHDITLRTTFITGFPGEDYAAYQKLLGFVKDSRFDNLGVFEFSPEEGTPAFSMRPKVPLRVSKSRRHEIMMTQQDISREILAAKVGLVLPVVCDGVADNGGMVCRTEGQAPEIDGVTYVGDIGESMIGKQLFVRITESNEYDLRGDKV